MKEKYYLRYCDDFIILGESREHLIKILIPQISQFLEKKLKLTLHPNKVSIREYGQGIDFLGYVVLPHYKVLRTKTKRRMMRKIKSKKQKLENDLISKESFTQSLELYRGVLKHCAGYNLISKINNIETTVRLL